MSRWGKQESPDLPASAEVYESWFADMVEQYRQNPFKAQWIAPKQTPNAWQMEGLRLVMEKRRRLAERDFGW